LYLTLIVFEPTVVLVRLQLVAGSVAVQESVPSEIVTVPVGVPEPGALTERVKLTAYGWPVTVGSGVSDTIDAVVSALLTVMFTLATPLSNVAPGDFEPAVADEKVAVAVPEL
jgi:hypothetical protein